MIERDFAMTETTVCKDSELHSDLQRRLRRMEGQVQGVQRMLEQGRTCMDILDQLKSIRSAAYGACMILMRQYAQECFRGAEKVQDRDKALEDMMTLLDRLPH
jgi:DNA-binding FrmR family transcriptional regulator